jgi:tRNA-dihydrouridine synthase
MLNLPKPFFVLAPMDDVTDTVFRQIVADCAPPDLYFTEFVNVDGLQSPGRPKLLKKLQFTDKETPIIAQIWGKNPENYYKTTKELKEMGFAGVDINMGCPVRNVVQNGVCSALIDNRGLAGEIIEAVGEATGKTDFPISVKTRLGMKQIDSSWPEFLLKYKLNMLTIHGRTVKEMSKVPAHWDEIGKVREMRDSLSPATLLIGNGDVESRQQGLELAEQYKLDGIMIGRGIFHDPYVFADQSPWEHIGKEERKALYAKHVKLFDETWPSNERRLPTLNKFCKIYIQGFDGAKELRDQLMHASSTDELLGLLA